MSQTTTTTTTGLRVGQRVRHWQGGYGVVEYVTADGWYGVREDSGRLDEWQGFQLAALPAGYFALNPQWAGCA